MVKQENPWLSKSARKAVREVSTHDEPFCAPRTDCLSACWPVMRANIDLRRGTPAWPFWFRARCKILGKENRKRVAILSCDEKPGNRAAHQFLDAGYRA